MATFAKVPVTACRSDRAPVAFAPLEDEVPHESMRAHQHGVPGQENLVVQALMFVLPVVAAAEGQRGPQVGESTPRELLPRNSRAAPDVAMPS